MHRLQCSQFPVTERRHRGRLRRKLTHLIQDGVERFDYIVPAYIGSVSVPTGFRVPKTQIAT